MSLLTLSHGQCLHWITNEWENVQKSWRKNFLFVFFLLHTAHGRKPQHPENLTIEWEITDGWERIFYIPCALLFTQLLLARRRRWSCKNNKKKRARKCESLIFQNNVILWFTRRREKNFCDVIRLGKLFIAELCDDDSNWKWDTAVRRRVNDKDEIHC